MAITDTNIAVKSLAGKLATDVNKRIVEEFGAETINTYAGEVWANTPDPTPATAIIAGDVELHTLLALTENVTVPNQESWTAEVTGNRVGDWVPKDKFGPNYGVRIFDGSDVEIPLGDQIAFGLRWNDKTGVLNVDSPGGYTKPFKITHHRYIGPKGFDASDLPYVTVTSEAITISMDSVGGTDPTKTTRIYNQAQADAWGAFKTVPAAIDALPSIIRHPVRLEFPDGDFALDDQFFGEMARFTFPVYDLLQSVYGRIQFASVNGLVVETATTSYAVSASSTKREVVLQSDPGFSANDHRSKFLRIVSGTGAGQYKAIRSHSGVNWPIAGRFSPVPDATSVVEIVRPAAKLTTTKSNGIIRAKINAPGTSFANLSFDALDFESSGSSAKLHLGGCLLRLEGGSRILRAAFGVYGSLIMNDCVIDGQGSPLGVRVQSGFLRTSSSAGTWLIRGMRAYGVALFAGSATSTIGSPAVAFLWEGAIDDTTSLGPNPGHAIRVDGMGAIVNFSGDTVQGSGNPGAGVSVTNGASVLEVDTATAIAEAESLTGTLGDLSLDGVVQSYTDLDNATNKQLTTTARSLIAGDV